MKCAYHKDREAKGYCEKYNRYLCDECMHCQDPGLYCKFRKQCVVWELEHHSEGGKNDAEAKSAGTEKENSPSQRSSSGNAP